MAKRRAKPEPIGQPSEAEPEVTFADIWAAVEPGARMGRGQYSIYKTPDEGMLIAYRPEGQGEDMHLPIPPAMMGMMVAASQGKGPLGRLAALARGMA